MGDIYLLCLLQVLGFFEKCGIHLLILLLSLWDEFEVKIFLLYVLISKGSCHKLSQIWWLETILFFVSHNSKDQKFKIKLLAGLVLYGSSEKLFYDTLLASGDCLKYWCPLVCGSKCFQTSPYIFRCLSFLCLLFASVHTYLYFIWSVIEFSYCFCCSVHKSCWTLWNPEDCSMPGSSVFHYLPEFAQIYVHWVDDAI